MSNGGIRARDGLGDLAHSFLSRAKYLLAAPLPAKAYWHLMGRFQPARAVTSRWPSLQESLDSGAGVVAMLDRLGLVKQDAVVLQIGCGIGRIEKHLHKRVRFCYGIDIAPSMIARARANVRASNVEFTCADSLVHLSSPRFDLIYAIYVFQHLRRETMRRYLEEAYAQLVCGGKVAFQILVDETGERTDPPQNHPYGIRYYRRADLSTLLTRIGFTSIRFLDFAESSRNEGFGGELLVIASKTS
jgi:SAM-dependent methyltransferase